MARIHRTSSDSADTTLPEGTEIGDLILHEDTSADEYYTYQVNRLVTPTTITGDWVYRSELGLPSQRTLNAGDFAVTQTTSLGIANTIRFNVTDSDGVNHTEAFRGILPREHIQVAFLADSVFTYTVVAVRVENDIAIITTLENINESAWQADSDDTADIVISSTVIQGRPPHWRFDVTGSVGPATGPQRFNVTLDVSSLQHLLEFHASFPNNPTTYGVVVRPDPDYDTSGGTTEYTRDFHVPGIPITANDTEANRLMYGQIIMLHFVNNIIDAINDGRAHPPIPNLPLIPRIPDADATDPDPLNASDPNTTFTYTTGSSVSDWQTISYEIDTGVTLQNYWTVRLNPPPGTNSQGQPLFNRLDLFDINGETELTTGDNAGSLITTGANDRVETAQSLQLFWRSRNPDGSVNSTATISQLFDTESNDDEAVTAFADLINRISGLRNYVEATANVAADARILDTRTYRYTEAPTQTDPNDRIVVHGAEDRTAGDFIFIPYMDADNNPRQPSDYFEADGTTPLVKAGDRITLVYAGIDHEYFISRVQVRNDLGGQYWYIIENYTPLGIHGVSFVDMRVDRLGTSTLVLDGDVNVVGRADDFVFTTVDESDPGPTTEIMIQPSNTHPFIPGSEATTGGNIISQTSALTNSINNISHVAYLQEVSVEQNATAVAENANNLRSLEFRVDNLPGTPGGGTRIFSINSVTGSAMVNALPHNSHVQISNRFGVWIDYTIRDTTLDQRGSLSPFASTIIELGTSTSFTITLSPHFAGETATGLFLVEVI